MISCVSDLLKVDDNNVQGRQDRGRLRAGHWEGNSCHMWTLETTLGFVLWLGLSCSFLLSVFIWLVYKSLIQKAAEEDTKVWFHLWMVLIISEVDCWVKIQNWPLGGFFLRFSIGSTSASRNSIQRKFYFTIIHQLVPVPSAGEVDGGKIADRVASCRHDPQGQHGHLLAQVRISILIFHKSFLN